jgi:hypothetical protein
LCASQQLSEQKKSWNRFRLQVEMAHFRYGAPNAIGFLQTLHLFHMPGF